MITIPNTTYSMNTLWGCLDTAVNKGFIENFHIVGNCLTVGRDCPYYYPEDVTVANFYRFEGQSDPDDNSILYLIETHDGMKGTLIDAYGVYADSAISKFIVMVGKPKQKNIWFKLFGRDINFWRSGKTKVIGDGVK